MFIKKTRQTDRQTSKVQYLYIYRFKNWSATERRNLFYKLTKTPQSLRTGYINPKE